MSAEARQATIGGNGAMPPAARSFVGEFTQLAARFREIGGLDGVLAGINATAARVDALESRVLALLRHVGDPGECSGCKRAIFWVRHRNGKPAPYDPDGLNHFATCPNREEFQSTEALNARSR